MAYEGETVFVAKPADRRLEEQRERLIFLLDRGSLTMVVFAGAMLVIALITTLSRGANWAIWLAPPALIACAAGMYVWLRRLEARPVDAIEVPEDLAEVLNDGISLYDELRVVVAEELEPEDRDEVTQDAEEHLDAALTSAADVLPALQADDQAAATKADAASRASIGKLAELAEEFGVVPQALGEAEFTGEELPVDDETVVLRTVPEGAEGQRASEKDARTGVGKRSRPGQGKQAQRGGTSRKGRRRRSGNAG